MRKATKDAVQLIDATRIPLNALSTSWAQYDMLGADKGYSTRAFVGEQRVYVTPHVAD